MANKPRTLYRRPRILAERQNSRSDCSCSKVKTFWASKVWPSQCNDQGSIDYSSMAHKAFFSNSCPTQHQCKCVQIPESSVFGGSRCNFQRWSSTQGIYLDHPDRFYRVRHPSQHSTEDLVAGPRQAVLQCGGQRVDTGQLALYYFARIQDLDPHARTGAEKPPCKVRQKAFCSCLHSTFQNRNFLLFHT